MHPKYSNITIKLVTMSQLFEYYRPKEIEGYCKSCPNYDKIWSCPPYADDVLSPFKAYEEVLLIGVETSDFEVTKRRIASVMNEIAESFPVAVLIAGNCVLCDPCSKVDGAPCKYPKQMKYSLESLGFHVSDICEQILGKKLRWEKENPTYIAVAAVMVRGGDVDLALMEAITQMLEAKM